MKKFIVETKNNVFLVIAETEQEALIKFSSKNPSLKVQNICETINDVYEIMI